MSNAYLRPDHYPVSCYFVESRHFYVARTRSGYVTNPYAEEIAAQRAASWIDECVDSGSSIDKRMIAGAIAEFDNGVKVWRIALAPPGWVDHAAARECDPPALFLVTLGRDDLPDTVADMEQGAMTEALRFSGNAPAP